MEPSLLRRTYSLFLPLALAAVALYGCSSAEDRARSYYERGTEYVSKGEPMKASLEFRNALRLKSDFVDAQYALGQVLEQQGDYANAVKAYFAVAEQATDNVPARVRLSYILLAGGQLDQAAKFVDQANAVAPKDPSVLVARAAIALKRGDAKEGVELANEGLKQQPGYADALVVLASERMLASDPAGALTFLDQVPSTSERDIGVQMLRLTALDAVGDGPGVEQLFRKLIDYFPSAVQLREGLANWYLSKGQKDEAEEVVRKFAADNAGDEQAELALVSFLYNQRTAEAAMAELEAAIRARSNGDDAFTFRQVLGQLKFSTGAQTEAVKLLRSLVGDTQDASKRNKARVQLAGMLAPSQPDETLVLLKTVLAEDERNVDALRLRASIALANGKFADATQDLLSALNEAPDNANLHAALAQAYEGSGEVVLAQEQYAKAAELNQYAPETGVPMARFFLRYGKTDQALRVLENVRRKAPTNREGLAMLAELKLSTQDWSGAQEIADTLRKLGEGTDPTADRIGAAALMGQDRYSEGIDLLQASLVQNGATGDQVLPDLIGAYIRSGKPEVAEDYLKTLLTKDSGSTEALILLGSVYMTQSKPDQAEAEFKKAADNQPDVDGDIALAQFYWSANNLEAAEAAASKGLEQAPDNIALGRLLAAIYERAERFDDAIAQYEKLFERDPSSAVTANDLASLLSERRTDDASLQRAYEIAQRLSGSEIPQYLDTLGWIYHLRNDQAGALPLLKTAAGRLPNVGLVHYHLGVVMASLGQTEAAKESFQRALDAKPPLLDADQAKVLKVLATINADKATPADGGAS